MVLLAAWNRAGSVKGLVLAIGFAIFVPSQTQADFAAYSEGHADVGVAYAGPGALELHWHLDDLAVVDGVTISETEFEPNEIRAIVPTTSNFARGASDATWGFLGNAAGQTTYFLPETPTVGVPYLGFGSEELDPIDWTTPNLSWNISSFSGPGHFSIFSDLGSPTLVASTFLGDLDFSTLLGGHSHFNLGFTQPGVYDVGFTVSGLHGVDGFATDTQTYRFDVTAVPEPTSIAGALALGGAWVVNYRRRRRSS